MKTQLSFIKKNYWLVVFMLLTTIGTTAQQVINATLQNDGRTRQYRLYVPASYDPSKPAPLILNFHGFTNNIDTQYNQSDFRQLAEDNQFLFVTPQGLGGFFSGWAIKPERLADELAAGAPGFKKPVLGSISMADVWIFFIRYICPVVIGLMIIFQVSE